MSEPLSIDVLTATVEPTGLADPAAVARRVGSLQRRMAGAELERAWSNSTAPTGHWCLRSLDLVIDLDLTSPDHALSGEWATAVVRALQESTAIATSSGSAAVVHYRHDLEALTDAVAGLAFGRLDRAWAWIQLGLLPSAPDIDSTQNSRSLVAALARRPELAVQAIASAVRRCGYAALSRALGDDGWQQVAETVWSARDHATVPPGFLARPRPADDRDGHDVRAGGSNAHPTSARSAGARSSDDRPAVVWPVGSELAQAVRSSSLIPTARTVDAVSLLIGLELDPNLPRRPGSWAMLESIRSALLLQGGVRAVVRPVHRDRRPSPYQPIASRPPAPPVVEHSAAGSSGGDPTGLDSGGTGVGTSGVDLSVVGASEVDLSGAGTAPLGPSAAVEVADADVEGIGHMIVDRPVVLDAASHRDGEPLHASSPVVVAEPTRDVSTRRAPGPEDDAQAEQPAISTGVWTAWAGLPFLLATAAATGLPDRLIDDPAFDSRPVAWCVHAAGRAITGAAPDDPGLLAFSGLHGRRAVAVIGARPADECEAAGIDRLARDWITVTASRLIARSPDSGPVPVLDPRDVVLAALRRPGTVVADPGWIEVHLSIGSTDLSVRRAGLDADPGWVDWLGTVVRYVYE